MIMATVVMPNTAFAEYERMGTGLEEVAFPVSIPQAPIVRSSTHPESDMWYSAKSARFEWDLPSGVTAVKASLTANPDDEPTNLYRNALSEIGIGDLEEGVWYFHLQLANLIGWSKTAHFKIQADLTPPENVIVKEVTRGDTTDPDLIFSITGEDAISGMGDVLARYQNEEILLQQHPNDEQLYILQDVPPGYGDLELIIKDGAGNEYPVMRDYHVEALTAPVIRMQPNTLKPGEPILFSGHTMYPGAEITARIEDANQNSQYATVTADQSGDFLIRMDQDFMDGPYQAFFLVTDQRGAKSLETKAISFMILTPFWTSIFFAGIILLIGLIALLGILFWRESAPKRAIRKQNRARIIEIKKELAQRDLKKEKGLVRIAVPRGKKSTEELLEELRDLEGR